MIAFGVIYSMFPKCILHFYKTLEMFLSLFILRLYWWVYLHIFKRLDVSVFVCDVEDLAGEWLYVYLRV